eukprot:gene5483-5889_t
MIYIIVFLLLHSLHVYSGHLSYVGICAVITNELDVVEWIDYHLQLDIHHLYLYQYSNYTIKEEIVKNYNNNNNNNTEKQVKLHTIDNPSLSIVDIYQQCLDKYRHHHQFIAFLTTDEFIVTKYSCPLSIILQQGFEKYGGLIINWKLFGSSNHIQRPEGGILSNYYQCNTYDHYRSIVNTNYVMKISDNPHVFIYKNQKYAIDSNYIRVDHSRNFPRQSLYDLIYINNYHLKSKTDFYRIFHRPIIFQYIGKNDHYFQHINHYCQEKCPLLTMPNKNPKKMSSLQCMEMMKERVQLFESIEPSLFST